MSSIVFYQNYLLARLCGETLLAIVVIPSIETPFPNTDLKRRLGGFKDKPFMCV